MEMGTKKGKNVEQVKKSEISMMCAKEAMHCCVEEMLLCTQVETRVNKHAETPTGPMNGGSGELPAVKRWLFETQL